MHEVESRHQPDRCPSHRSEEPGSRCSHPQEPSPPEPQRRETPALQGRARRQDKGTTTSFGPSESTPKTTAGAAGPTRKIRRPPTRHAAHLAQRLFFALFAIPREAILVGVAGMPAFGAVQRAGLEVHATLPATRPEALATVGALPQPAHLHSTRTVAPSTVKRIAERIHATRSAIGQSCSAGALASDALLGAAATAVTSAAVRTVVEHADADATAFELSGWTCRCSARAGRGHARARRCRCGQRCRAR